MARIVAGVFDDEAAADRATAAGSCGRVPSTRHQPLHHQFRGAASSPADGRRRAGGRGRARRGKGREAARPFGAAVGAVAGLAAAPIVGPIAIAGGWLLGRMRARSPAPPTRLANPSRKARPATWFVLPA